MKVTKLNKMKQFHTYNTETFNYLILNVLFSLSSPSVFLLSYHIDGYCYNLPVQKNYCFLVW